MAKLTVYVPAPDAEVAQLIHEIYLSSPVTQASNMLEKGLVNALREQAEEFLLINGLIGEVFEFQQELPDFLADSTDLLESIGLTVTE